MPQTGILVVEDDHFVLKFLKQLVPELFPGTAFFAKNAEEAMTLWRQHHSEISHLLTDLTLPGTSGEQLASKLIVEKPSLRIIVSTGMPVPIGQLESTIQAKIALVEKPFDASAMARVFSEDNLAIAA
jgi:DNA-binding NtrC family response regulator